MVCSRWEVWERSSTAPRFFHFKMVGMLTLKRAGSSAWVLLVWRISSRIAGIVLACLCSLTIIVVTVVGPAEAGLFPHKRWQVSTGDCSNEHPGCDIYKAFLVIFFLFPF